MRRWNVLGLEKNDMDDLVEKIIVGAIALCLVLFVYTCGEAKVRTEAVKNGVAHWEVVNDYGGTKFKWNTNK